MDSAATDRPARRPRTWSVRFRILTAVLMTTALGMTAAGLTSYAISRQDVYKGVRDALHQEVNEFRVASEEAMKGPNRANIVTVADLLRATIKATYPDDNEAVIGLVNGQLELHPNRQSELQTAVQGDQEVIAEAAKVRPGGDILIKTISNERNRNLAFVSVTAQIEGQPDLGHYVAAVDIDTAFVPLNNTYRTYALVCVAALILVGLVGFVVSGRLLAPLRTLRETAHEIGEGNLSGRIPEDQLTSGDEIADLGHTMNAMLDRLSSSFDEQRNLLDDAGHELRTPITILQGHLELLDQRNPTEVAETVELSLDELARMRRIVEDLMILAKSRRPDFVRPTPVDVDDLLTSVLDKVRPLADRQWRIERTVHAVIELDPQRITQALVQLVSNAVRHSPEGSVIALSASVISVVAADPALPPAGERLRLSVRDEGSGIPPDDHQRIFERFARSGPAQPGHDHPEPMVRDHAPGQVDGSGLGLAIVDAIAKAHRGQVLLDSALGHGSTFTLEIPIVTERDHNLTEDELFGGPADEDHHQHRTEQESRWLRS
ncbi:sensor histidine kinase [Microlunatus speluncae]|uniref:sensor histidine kinase n=1 Tax=Microlunatus speluncae TaxID=2594267 RepID=UPI0012666D34|nr:HAMP domain-containing sensor histidine kinase [Microlunatus speluncae]